MESAKQQVAAALDPLVAELRAALGFARAETPGAVRDTAAGGSRASRAKPRRAVDRLLSEFDPGAADFIEANRAALRPLFADEAWREFEQLVQGYAFADAQAQLEQALDNFPKRLLSPDRMKNLSDCRVLLVDDAKANLDILVEALEGRYKLSLALDGEHGAAQRREARRPTSCCSTS